jgi:hypothetical protein
VLAIAAILVSAGAVVAATVRSGRIGPDNRVQPSGRKLDPVGRLTKLGNLPTGGALTVDGRFAWTLSAGRGRNDIRIVRVLPTRCHSGSHRRVRHCRERARRRVGKVVQRIKMPGVSGGIAMAPDGKAAYVSGTPEGDKASNEVGA